MNNESAPKGYHEKRNELADQLIRLLGANTAVLDPFEIERLLAKHGTAPKDARAALCQCLDGLASLADEQEPDEYDESQTGLLGLLARFANLDKRERDLKATLKDVQAAKERLVGSDGQEGPLVEEWLNSAAGNITLQGRLFYAYPDRRLVRKPDVDPHSAVTALRRARLGSLVTETFNSNSLKSWLKEREESGKPLPPGVEKCFTVMEKLSIRSRKAAASARRNEAIKAKAISKRRK